MKQLSLVLLLVFTSVFSQRVYSQANTALSNLTSTSINQSLLPSSNNNLSLGSTTRSWRFIYLDSALYLKDLLTIHSRGTGNFFTGQNAGNLTLTGTYNAGFGQSTLPVLSSGSSNTALGFSALYVNTTGSNNTSVGVKSLSANTSGRNNSAVGYRALYSNTSGFSNVGVGYGALYTNTTANNLVAVGDSALFNNSIGGINNTALGSKTLFANTSGAYNTAVGTRALFSNTTGLYNVAVGHAALNSNTFSSQNTAIGYNAMLVNNSGGSNTALGAYAGYYNSTNSTFIGWDTYGSTVGVTNSTALGYHAPTTASNQVRIGDGNVTSIGGQVGWTNFSDGRFKKDIKENVPGLAFIQQLRPVTYNLDIDGYDKALRAITKHPGNISDDQNVADRQAADASSKIIYTGFIAQEVEASAKKMNYEFSGVDAPKNDKDFYGLRYAEFVVPLVKAVQELNTKNNVLEARIEKLEALLKTSSFSALLMDGSLEQNTPNPVKGNTRISYQLPSKYTAANIVISDAAGKRLKTINVSGTGRGSLNLDAATLPSGTYQYSLYVDKQIADSKQFIIAR